MGDLEAAVESVVARVAKHGNKGFNEENTAVVLIEPVLDALGWDLADLGSVDRQYRVFDGTKLDYALKEPNEAAGSDVDAECNGLSPGSKPRSRWWLIGRSRNHVGESALECTLNPCAVPTRIKRTAVFRKVD